MIKVLYRFFLCFTMTLAASSAFSQNDLGDALKGSIKDANSLANGYITPIMKVMGTGINAGWNNTAKPHKTLGLDLTFTVSPVFIPSSDKLYEVDNSKLENIQLVSTHDKKSPVNGKGFVPTIFGPETSPKYAYVLSGTKVPDLTRTFDGPPGIDLKKSIGINALPIPMVQLGIGIYKNTDLKFRFYPQQQFGDFKVSLFGIGVLHDVKQWIPGIKNLPFDLSGFVGFTKLKVQMQLDPGQTGDFEVSGTTIQGLISKKIAVLTVYGGFGYNIAKSSIALKGSYDLDDNGSTPAVKDPLTLSATATGPRVTAGMRLKLAFFTFHGDYTLQKYKTLSVGFGIAIR